MTKKHAIIAIIVVLALVFLVLPLIYITIGKLRSPVDSVANKIQTPLSSQNYIPVTADAADPSQIHKGTETFNFVLEKACNASGTPMIPSDVTAIFDSQNRKASISSDLFRFSWNLTGDYEKTKPYGAGSSPYAVLFGGGDTPESRMVMSIWGGKYNSLECASYWQNMFGLYNDSGRMLQDGKWSSQGLAILEKGLTTINGNKYYWYLFEDTRLRGPEQRTKSLLTDDKYSNQVYTAIYDTYHNGIKYRVTFSGDKAQNKSYRNIIKFANLYLNNLQLR